MQLSEKELDEILVLKRAKNADTLKDKERIKEILLDNNKIIYMLNNKELEEADAPNDEYYGVNILPYYMINPTQSNVQNFICYEIGYNEEFRYNDKMRINQLTFYVLCKHENIIEKHTGVARHDLIGELLLEQFEWTNYFGQVCHCVSNLSSVVDTDYACRTLIFEFNSMNGLTKPRNGRNTVINKEVHY